MTSQNIIILVVAIIIGIILIKFIAKTFLRILIILAVAVVICYLLFFYNGGIKGNGDKQFLLYELQAKYCNEKLDTVKCECIINPLLADLTSKYKPEELLDISKDPVRSAEVLIKLINENKEDIKACLKEKDAEYAWKDFTNDIKSLKLGEKFMGLIKGIIYEEEKK